MLDLGLLTIPLLSLLAVFGFAVITDVNMIAFDVKSVPKMALDMGFDANNVRNTIMYKIHNIASVAETSRGVSYSTISDMRHQSLRNISETLRIEDGVLAAQGFLGLIPYRLKGKIMQEGDVLSLVVTGFSSDNHSFIVTLKGDKPVFDSSQIIKGQTGLPGSTASYNTQLTTTNADIEISSLLTRAAEAIVDRIDPYLLARYYFVLESRDADFTKTIPQLARCIDVIPAKQKIWPLLLWGRTYQFKGDYAKAIEVYQRIVTLDPKFPFAPLRWGEALATQEQYQEAIVMYQKAIYNSRFFPDYPVARSAAYQLWADALIALGQIDQAEKTLNKGVDAFYFGNEQSAANALSHYALGMFLMHHKQDYKNAEYHLRRAIYMDDHPKYYEALQEVTAKTIPGYADYLVESTKNTTTQHKKQHKVIDSQSTQ